MYKIFLIILHILYIIFSEGFIIKPLPQIPIKQYLQKCNCNERTIYKNYLIGLRKTRRYIHNTTNIDSLVSILNFTNDFVDNYSIINNSTLINNTNIGIKTITAGNMVLDVSNVKTIYISTKNDKIIIELDKQNDNNIINVLERINNIDALINTLSLFSKLLNIS